MELFFGCDLFIVVFRSSLVIRDCYYALRNLVFNGAWLFSTVKKAFSDSLHKLLFSLDNLRLNVLFLKVLMLTLFRMGFFAAAHWCVCGVGGSKRSPIPKICHTYSTMMKTGSYTLLKEDPKNICHVTHPMSSADISIFSPEFSKLWYIKKYGYRLHFNW